MLGRAPILDFDGTLTRLPVDWDGLRSRLGVRTLRDLEGRDPDAWRQVTQAEVDAAHSAVANEAAVDALHLCSGFAVLTDNSETAVTAFLERNPALGCRCLAVVGRETLGRSKREPEAFARGFDLCLKATAPLRSGELPVYIGDRDWELEAARRLGALAIGVSELGAPQSIEAKPTRPAGHRDREAAS
ncbi:MAG: hypothetical protein ABSC16_00980 [Candidatus Dormibacteria bacterium]|jgi:phosphoglycolate phosphatase-like HAD superfamily hydrolase